MPHIQRVPSRIVRDELAHEISQKLGIDSAVLRQELKHVASTRSAATVKAPAEAQITDAEKILIRALASATQMQIAEEHLSARDGAEEEFDPARQARYVLQTERLHEGMSSQSLLESLLEDRLGATDVMAVPNTEDDRRLLASILMYQEEELTAETLEGAVRALRKIFLRRRAEHIQRELQRPSLDKDQRRTLLEEKLRLERAQRDPSFVEQTNPPAA
jgi:DNA primase